MLSYSELTKGKIIIINNQPYEIIEAFNTFKGRGHSYLQMKLKNLVNGNVIAKSAQPRDSFEEADIDKKKPGLFTKTRINMFLQKLDNPSKRFELSKEQIGEEKA